MRRATVDSMIRWVSFGTSAMPRLPPLADHEYAVEFDDGFAAPPAEERFPGERPAGVVLVEVNLVPVPGQQGEPHIVRLGDGPSDPAAHLGADPEVLEERPVVVHATLGERGSRNVMNVM